MARAKARLLREVIDAFDWCASSQMRLHATVCCRGYGQAAARKIVSGNLLKPTNKTYSAESPTTLERASFKWVGAFTLRHGMNFEGRLCHGAPEALLWGNNARRRLGLRIISSKAEDGGQQQEADGDAKQGYDSGASKERAEKRSSSVLNTGIKYSVIRINSNGTWESLLLNTSELGIHPRDIDLLAGNFFIPKRSAIAVRNDKVLVRMENVRVLVCKDHCLLFDAHRPRKGRGNCPHFEQDVASVRQHAPVALHKAREAFAMAMAEQVKQLPPHSHESMPFHLRMIECLLDETCHFFHQKVERLKLVVERMLEELTNDVDMGGLQRLLPLKRALTEVEHDVRDTHEAMDQVLGSDDTLQAFCFEGEELSSNNERTCHSAFSQKESHINSIRQAAADMLVTYQREIDDAGGVLEELRKDMESAQEVWELGLDTTRNRIIRMNLYITIATVSFSLATVPASFFGMNLLSGLENNPQMFHMVVRTTSAAALILFLNLAFFFRFWPSFKDKQRAQDLAALRDLLQHIDDIDDIFQAVTSQGGSNQVTQEEFQQMLRGHPSIRFMRKRELDLMFRMFDSNRNGLLEEREWNAVSHRRLKQKVF